MRRTVVLLACAAMLVAVTPAGAADPPDFDYAGPVFGLNADPDGNLLVSDAGLGVVSLTETEARQVVAGRGGSDAVRAEDGSIISVTGEPPEEANAPGTQLLSRIESGVGVTVIADLWEWEQANNPDQNDPLIGDDNVQSNPYDLARIEGATLVADAAGNVLLEVQDDGTVEWKALFPARPLSTQPLQDLVGCPEGPSDICDLPPELPTEAVPTSVAVGPDGNYYVGELTGFPGTPGAARIWKVSPDATNAVCGQDASCEQVFTSRPFTAVIDVAFGPDGTFYVLELDEDGFMAAEMGIGSGGTLNACHLGTEACVELATGLAFPTATAVGNHGSVYATIDAMGSSAAVVELAKEFGDDNGSVHELDIAVLAAAGITRGCNPPENSSFCPDDGTTRGQMAAFLVRALGLPASDGGEFGDVSDSVFEGDINALAAAGITRGCNPPDNDRFCPDDTVTRGQMAAFLVRALDLPTSDGGQFDDVADSVFEGDIGALAAAGITRGCNPPDNDRFCPDDIVTRAQMASFLVRAIDDLS